MEKRVSNTQFKALIITGVVGVGVLSLPSSIARIANNDGWISIVIGGAISVLLMYLMVSLAQMHPGKVVFEYARELLGNFGFYIFAVIYIIYFMMVLAVEVRIFAEVIKVFLLENTPIEVIIISMLITSMWIGRYKIEVVARIALLMYTVLFVIIIFGVIAVFPQLDFTNIFPLFQTNVKTIIGGVRETFFSYLGIDFVLVSLAYLEEPKEAMKYSMRAILSVTLLYVFAFVLTISTFGVNELKRQVWPTIALVREVDFPGFFLENIDGIIMAAWVLIIYGNMAPTTYNSTLVFSNIFKTKEHGLYVLPLVPIVYFISLFPQNLYEVYKNMLIPNILGFIVMIIFPILLFILSKIKGGRTK